MITDSENNMMNKLFSLHSIGEGRFLLLILLLANFQIMQAVCRHDALSPDIAIPSAVLFISEGTVISGVEKIYVTPPAKEKVQKKFKRKNSVIPAKRKQKTEENLSKPIKSSHKTGLIFSINNQNQSGKSLLAVSNSEKQIVIPNQHTIKFLLLEGGKKIPIPSYLLNIFLKKVYKNHELSSLRFFKNFNRPPPSLCMTIT